MFNVLNIVNGNTIEVSPRWKWGEFSGNLVQLSGGFSIASNTQYNQFAVSKLNTLIKGKPIELKNPIKVIGQDTLLCSIFLNEIDIIQYFPEFKTPV